MYLMQLLNNKSVLSLIKKMINFLLNGIQELWTWIMKKTKEGLDPQEIEKVIEYDKLKAAEAYGKKVYIINMTSLTTDLRSCKTIWQAIRGQFPDKVLIEIPLEIMANDTLDGCTINYKNHAPIIMVVDRYVRGEGITFINNIIRGLKKMNNTLVMYITIKKICSTPQTIHAHKLSAFSGEQKIMMMGESIAEHGTRKYMDLINANIKRLESVQSNSSLTIIIDRSVFYGDAVMLWAQERNIVLDLEDTKSNLVELSAVWNYLTRSKWSNRIKNQVETLPVSEEIQAARRIWNNIEKMSTISYAGTILKIGTINLKYEQKRIERFVETRLISEETIGTYFPGTEDKESETEDDENNFHNI